VCGIAGGTGVDDPQRRAVLAAQLGTLRRRGPDSWGFLPGDGATVGQTRLAIIDLQHGDPPLTDESGDIRVALNGEIYNYRALLHDLRERGHETASSCDTEVIAHLAEELEPRELAQRLEGMFAFAIWDARRRRLVLGRDRLGKKPLYYWHDGRELVFGSEIKAVLADPRVPRRLNRDVLVPYLAYGYAPTPHTFFDGIVALPPATVLVRDDQGVRLERYWDVPAPQANELNPVPGRELARTLRGLLQEAVQDRLVSDVPLGAFLSGGVDSSAVVALMAQGASQPVRTFCIGFEDEQYDERRWARLVADHLGTCHEEEVVRPNAATLLDDVLEASDQPFADSSAVPTYLLAQMTKRHVTVALSGDGGDECFAGYERFAAALALARVEPLLRPISRVTGTIARGLGGSEARGPRARAGRLLAQLGAPMPEAYLAWVRIFGQNELDALSPEAARSSADLYQPIWQASSGAPLLSRLLDLNRRTYLLDDLLVKVDRMSMAHGLEVRSPLLDRRIVEFAAHVPPRYQVRGWKLKRLLKTAVADLLPREVLTRPKKGFGVPLDAWFRGTLRSEAQTRLLSPASRIGAHLNTEAVARIVAEHDSGAAANGQRLWSLLMLERFLDRENF
jgi:asparagine synthase (glutamine-hydrolysing)